MVKTKTRPAAPPAREQTMTWTPIWDGEFAARWAAMHDDDPDAENQVDERT